MHSSLQTMLDAAAQIRQSEEITHRAFADSVGYAADQPEDWSVLAIVANRRLVVLEIDESVIELYRNMPNNNDNLPEVQLALYVNTIIRGAFQDYREKVAEKLRP
ncbi:hypothetical protein [Rhodococcus qingshengii]|uniref:hypothetical protein n=1 Tax=Rhodococcus qingshengii TaxID=334542 RepID=UPI001F1298D7|nr:hypothetical protein [Rhodococcus qingshengii]ULD38948.1 hypothetical protein JKI97_00060 [Rhodococcus qingshengii]